MFATDASGKGSLVYGKTSQHILEAEVVYADGQCGKLRPYSADELQALRGKGDRHSRTMCQPADLCLTHADDFIEHVPKMTRFVTGYNLAHARLPKGGFNPIPLFCGDEGSLGCIVSLTVRLTPCHRPPPL